MVVREWIIKKGCVTSQMLLLRETCDLRLFGFKIFFLIIDTIIVSHVYITPLLYEDLPSPGSLGS